MAVFKTVEYVEVTLTADTDPVTVNLTKGQDPTQCTPFFTDRNTGALTNANQDRMAEVTFLDNSGTPAVRVSASARTDNDASVFQVFVVEWDSSITVQQISVTGFTGSSLNQTITDVTSQANAFLIYSYQFTASSSSALTDCTVHATYNGASTTSVSFSRGTTVGTVNGTLYVVEAGAGEFTVQHVSIPIGVFQSSITVGISSTVLADTFLIQSYVMSPGSTMAAGCPQTDLQNTTTVRSQRSAAPFANIVVKIAVVECQNNEWDVQRNATLTLSSTSVTSSITAIDQSRSFINCLDHTGHPVSVGRNPSTSDAEIDDIQSAADFSTDALVRYRKRTTTRTDDIVSFEVVQFKALPVIPVPLEGSFQNTLLRM